MPSDLSTPEKKGPPEVCIGAVLPLSGPMTMVGLEFLNGMNLAVDIVNGDIPDLDVPLAQGLGLTSMGGATVRVVTADHKGSAEQASQETERLIIQGKCVALMGAYSNPTTAAAALVAEKYGIPFLDDSSTDPLLVKKGYRWYFRTALDDAGLAALFHPFFRTLKEKDLIQDGRLGFLHADEVLTSSYASVAVKQAKEYKYNVVADISFSKGLQPFTTQMVARKLKETGTSVIWHFANPAETVAMIKAFKEIDFNPEGIVLVNVLEPETQMNLGKDAIHLMAVQRWAPDLKDKKPLFDKVNKLYKQKFGIDMGEYAVRGFTSMLVLCDAVNRAGSDRPEAVRKALEKTDIPGKQLLLPWKGVKFDDRTRQNTLASGVVVQIREKQRVTIWPPESASSGTIWPVPRWKERTPE